jgi:hypothetical protein
VDGDIAPDDIVPMRHQFRRREPLARKTLGQALTGDIAERVGLSFARLVHGVPLCHNQCGGFEVPSGLPRVRKGTSNPKTTLDPSFFGVRSISKFVSGVLQGLRTSKSKGHPTVC